jgi:hypothetical protein
MLPLTTLPALPQPSVFSHTLPPSREFLRLLASSFDASVFACSFSFSFPPVLHLLLPVVVYFPYCVFPVLRF